MKRTQRPFEEIHDAIGFRVITDTQMHCYQALGVAHQTWTPIPGRFKDYIALPKPNLYQSLHTAVIGPRGERIEIQIRTSEMNLVAEHGIAAHWKYKEGKPLVARGRQEVRVAAPADGVARRSCAIRRSSSSRSRSTCSATRSTCSRRAAT